jgi:hypothetical protein
MFPRSLQTAGAIMILTTRTIGLLVTMALVTGGAAWGVHALLTPTDGAGSDYGLDTNGNGKFEWLVVEAQVSLPSAGTWDVYADLLAAKEGPAGSCGVGRPVPAPMMARTAGGMPIAWASERYFFPAGTQTVRMAFSGTDISRAGVDGPYSVHARLSLGGLPYMGIPSPKPIPSGGFAEWNYTTRSYSVADFEAPIRPAYFTGNHADAAVDVDGNGLADFLEITADVHVNTAGHFTLYGTLSEASGSDATRVIAYAYRDFNLTTDDTKVFLRFRGDQIRQSNIDGPWNFSLTLSEQVGLPYAVTGQPATGLLWPVPFSYPEMLCGSTGTYRAADFDTAVELLKFTGRFEESTPDWDADGKFDALVIRAELDVLVGAGFDLAGTLRSVGGTTEVAHATSQVWLRDGPQWVEFVFPGSQIRASGIDGPYEATLSIKPGPTGIDPTTTYVTKAYRAIDFDNETSGARGYWISNLTATPAGSSLDIAVGVTRGPDMLAVVFEDTLEVRVTDAAGTLVGSFQAKVVLASSGTEQPLSLHVDGLSSATYTVTAILGPESKAVDTKSVTVTL